MNIILQTLDGFRKTVTALGREPECRCLIQVPDAFIPADATNPARFYEAVFRHSGEIDPETGHPIYQQVRTVPLFIG